MTGRLGGFGKSADQMMKMMTALAGLTIKLIPLSSSVMTSQPEASKLEKHEFEIDECSSPRLQLLTVAGPPLSPVLRTSDEVSPLSRATRR